MLESNLKYKITSWLLTNNEKNLKKIIVINDYNISLFIFNLIFNFNDKGYNYFKIKYSETDLFFKILFKNNPLNKIDYDDNIIYYNKKYNNEDILLQELCLSYTKNIFDTIIFKDQYYNDKNNLNKLIKLLESLTNNIFLDINENDLEIFKANKFTFSRKTIPKYFNKIYSEVSITDFIVGCFEFNIIKCFFKDITELYFTIPIKDYHIDNYLYYKSLSVEEKLTIIKQIMLILKKEKNDNIQNKAYININISNNYKNNNLKHSLKVIESIIKNNENNNQSFLKSIYFMGYKDINNFYNVILFRFCIIISNLAISKFIKNIQISRSASLDHEQSNLVNSSSNDCSNNISDSFSLKIRPKNNKNKDNSNININNNSKINEEKEKIVDNIEEINNKILKIPSISSNNTLFFDNTKRKPNSAINKNISKKENSRLSVREISDNDLKSQKNLGNYPESYSRSFKTKTMSTKEESICNKLILKKIKENNPSENSFCVTPEGSPKKNNKKDSEDLLNYSTTKSTEENIKKSKINIYNNYNAYYNKNNIITTQKYFNYNNNFKKNKLSNINIYSRINSSYVLNSIIEEMFYNKIDSLIKSKIFKIKSKIKSKISSFDMEINVVKNTIYDCFPGCYIDKFGSYYTNLMNLNSDIDLLVSNINYSSANSIILLSNVLKKNNNITKNEPITTAKVPVLKIIINSTLKLDITFSDNKDTFSGFQTSDFIKKSKENYPNFDYLYYFIKEGLQEKGLTNFSTGGINSYALSLLILSYLFVNKNVYNSNSITYNLDKISNIIESFYIFYQNFNFETYAILYDSIKNPIIYKNNNDLFSNIVIYDPTKSNYINITNNCFLFNNIKQEFHNKVLFFKELKNIILKYFENLFIESKYNLNYSTLCNNFESKFKEIIQNSNSKSFKNNIKMFYFNNN